MKVEPFAQLGPLKSRRPVSSAIAFKIQFPDFPGKTSHVIQDKEKCECGSYRTHCCVYMTPLCLHSLDFLEAFPIDTWIKKGVQKTYFNGEKVGEKKMEEFVKGHFGPYAGYAQLYLYHYWRNHPF